MLPDYSVIGRRIKKTRIKNKLKQETLAEKIDVSVAYLSRVERGNAQINIKSKDYMKDDFIELLGKCTPSQQRLIYQIAELIYKNGIEMN